MFACKQGVRWPPSCAAQCRASRLLPRRPSLAHACSPHALTRAMRVQAEGIETVQVLPSIPSMLLAHQVVSRLHAGTRANACGCSVLSVCLSHCLAPTLTVCILCVCARARVKGWRGNGSKRVRRVSELIMGRAQDSVSKNCPAPHPSPHLSNPKILISRGRKQTVTRASVPPQQRSVLACAVLPRPP